MANIWIRTQLFCYRKRLFTLKQYEITEGAAVRDRSDTGGKLPWVTPIEP